jgi:hypothetical protein
VLTLFKCIISKAVGKSYGVSKNAAVTVVRVPRPVLTQEDIDSGVDKGFRYTTSVDALRLVLQDVINKNLQYRAVINLSWGFTNDLGRIPLPGEYTYEIYQVLQALIAENVVVVTSSGNSGKFIYDQDTGEVGTPEILKP